MTTAESVATPMTFGSVRVDGAATVPMWIDGAPADAERVEESTQPATGHPLARRSWAGPGDVVAAIDAATRAAPAWRALSIGARGDLVAELARRITARTADFGLLDALDTGSPVGPMTAGATKGAQQLALNAACGVLLHGRTIPASATGWHLTKHEPFGVVGAISAYNHPTLFACQKIGPALVAGNTVVLKPSEQASISAVALAALSEGLLPPGVLNVVPGGADVGAALVEDDRVCRLSFTGSVESGLAVQTSAGRGGVLKHLTLELGGKNPMIVFPDVDPARAAAAAVKGMNFTRVQGQSCGSTSRLLVHRAIVDEVSREVVERVQAIVVGLPDDPATEMGSLVSRQHQSRVLGMIEQARADGATVLTGGATPGDPSLAAGSYVEPTVLSDVAAGSAIEQHEVFGPVLAVMPWDDLDDALRVANGVRYGLTASVWTSDIDLALSTADRVEAGYVWINDVETRYTGVPFGGWKQSGRGTEQALLDEIETFTRTKAINIAVHG